jgi:high-affinity nickel permease
MGLGFDTATQVALLVLAGAGGVHAPVRISCPCCSQPE